MIELEKAHKSDVETLTKIQIRTFVDDNKLKPPGCSMEGPPGYDSIDWNIHWIQTHPTTRFCSTDKLSAG